MLLSHLSTVINIIPHIGNLCQQLSGIIINCNTDHFDHEMWSQTFVKCNTLIAIRILDSLE